MQFGYEGCGRNTEGDCHNIGNRGHCSYIYIGSVLSLEKVGVNAACIAAIEDPDNHGLNYAFVLYDDGYVERQPIEVVVTYLNDLNKGLNPSTTPVTMSAAQARQDYLKNWKQRMPALKSGAWKIPTTRPAK